MNKYNARLFLIPKLAKLGRRLGKSWSELGEKYGREVMISQAQELMTQSSDGSVEKSSKPLDIVFLTMIGGHTYNTSIDIVLGLALKARGHKVRFVVCDQQLPVCEVKKNTNSDQWESACKKCWLYGKTIYSKFNLDVVRLSELISGRQPKSPTDRWDDIVEASLLKHFGVGVLDSTEKVLTRRAEYEKTVRKTQMVGEAIVEMSPDRVLMSHGIYSTWGPQLRLFNEADIPVITFSKCKKKHTEKFNWSTSGDWWDVSKEWEIVRDKPLDQQQMKRIDAYLESRRDHSSDTLKYNFGAEETKQESYQRLGLDPAKPTFVAFTNVLWDAASAQREIVFDNPIQWIIESIKWFKDHPDLQLVVKIHPAEVVIGTNQPFASIINAQIRELPENVRIIEPHEEVNSWSIMQIADLGLVHTSTIGMEMPLEGVPCAVVSKTHFRGRGFTIDLETKDEYFNLIRNWNREDHDIETMRVLAKRYAFVLFERYQLPFKFFFEPKHTDVRAMNFTSVENLVKHPVIKLISDSIETQDEFLMPADVLEIEKFWAEVS